MSAEADSLLTPRAARAGIDIPPALRDSLLVYYALLSRWNAKINLTSLTDAEDAVDRLLLEPAGAARFLPAGKRLMDLGSGGGSPAIPLALALGSCELVMVESRAKKAAFLREAAAVLRIRTTVETERFETLQNQGRYLESMDIVTMRAVRMDRSTISAAVRFLRPQGTLALFVSRGTEIPRPERLEEIRVQLLNNAELLLLRQSVPRGTVP